MEPAEISTRIATALDLDEAEHRRLLGDTDPTDVDSARLRSFLDALIEARRGSGGTPPPPRDGEKLENLALKKLRVALNLQESDMLAILKKGGMHVGPRQLGALFRAPTNKRFKHCSDGTLLCFLTGLKRWREDQGA